MVSEVTGAGCALAVAAVVAKVIHEGPQAHSWEKFIGMYSDDCPSMEESW